MPYTAEQKIKLLILWDILCRNTDDSHALNTDEIIEMLAEKGINVVRKVLVQDIDLLNRYGYEVLSYKKKYHYYYVASRVFDTAEIVMLADVVKASKLTSSQKSTLIEKLSETNGKYALRNYSVSGTPKRSNHHIVYSIDAIGRAIAENKKISFKYFSLDYQAKRVYRNNGNRYIVNPIATIWNKDNYYLLSLGDNSAEIKTYRIDRMTDVAVESAQREHCLNANEINPERYRTQAFSMFGGELEEVRLQFTKALIDEMFDKFGEDIQIEKIDEETYSADIPVQVSKTFFAWVIGTQGKMRILSPQRVCEQFDAFVTKIKEKY